MKVHDVVKKYNLTKKDIINIVDYADEHLYLKDEIEKLEWQLDSILNQKDEANTSLLSIKKKHAELVEQIDKYNDISVGKSSYIENLDSKIRKLESYISKLKTSDEYYTKFEQFAKEKLDSIINDRRWLLGAAVGAVIESIRKDPDKQMIINNIVESEESYQANLLDLSEELFEKILKQLIDVTLQLKATQDINGVNTSSSVQ